MRYYILLFLLPVFVSAQPPPVSPKRPVTPRTGALCCASSGIADPTYTCKNMGLDSFCCTAKPNFKARGCDGLGGIASTGRSVKGFPPPNGECGWTGFIGCA
ncbi:uncharacterized protein PgNI_10000 [Pyricularia grisea]|uniref:Hydrophobin-like protein n=1 Tax=Pyricularia grisea TaxID=148305 RepID=A0A6P8AS38_PYRGI|nr:uncharacterized protein PgNI_10000 [Pyricularia grisea]TLD04939.1 hypothetical protein PgNI_10000 [Pyricularia grisea]